MRKKEEIAAAEREMYDRRWYDKHQLSMQSHHSGERVMEQGLLKIATDAAKQIEEKYGESTLGPMSDFEWGVLYGKHTTLRWVQGDDWGNGDT